MIAAAMIGMCAMAQTQFGAKVGFDMTNFWGKGAPHGMVPNFQVGLLMEHQFNNTLGIAPEVVFATQGSKLNIKAADTKVYYNTNYINVPVMLKFYASPEFSIDFGPQVGFNVYSKSTTKYSKKSDFPDEKINIRDHTKKVDFGVGLGATYKITENAFVQARYTLGLTDVYTKELSEKTWRNGNVQMAFGMLF